LICALRWALRRSSAAKYLSVVTKLECPKSAWMVGTLAPDRAWNVAHVFLSVWMIHFLQTGCVEQGTRLRS
jgi:hypothetical protein